MHWMLMPLRRYAEFSGRSRRKEYWMFFLGAILFYILIFALMVAVGGGALLGTEDGAAGMTGALAGFGILGIVLIIAVLLLFIPSLAVGVRRLHDIDRTGWWLLVPYVPYILSIVFATTESVELAAIFNLISLAGFLLLFVFALLPGTVGPNRFGPDPKGDTGDVFA